MAFSPSSILGYGLLWWLVSALGGLGLARMELVQLREAFEVDARISHRLLSQRAAQHEAVLATLALLQPKHDASQSQQVEQRLSSVYPQILSVLRSEAGAPWPSPSLEEAGRASQRNHAPVMANVDLSAQRGRYQLVLAADPASFALLIDVQAAVPWSDWSMPVQSSPVRVTLEHAGQAYVIQPGRLGESGWRFEFRKHLSNDSQAFDLVAVRQVAWTELPWLLMLLWALGVAAVLSAWAAWQRQRSARVRAEGLLRVGQVARLNTLGVLAAGMAHELNQPLTAMLANTQAAKRLLQEGPEELARAQGAMDQAVAQARRASDVVARLRRTVEQPNSAESLQALDLAQVVQAAMQLLAPDCQQHCVSVAVDAGAAVMVSGERVALEQIVHNLVTNALQALDQVPAPERRLLVQTVQENGQGVLRVADSGPGIAPEAMAHVFAPFYTTRKGGLGLGLTLCETLTQDMGGQLRVEHNAPRGVAFVLSLPLAAAQ
jgi:signal transduction histidine kinase